MANARERREAASSGTRAQRPPDLLLVFQHPGTFQGGFCGLFLSSFFNSMWVLTNLERKFFCL